MFEDSVPRWEAILREFFMYLGSFGFVLFVGWAVTLALVAIVGESSVPPVARCVDSPPAAGAWDETRTVRDWSSWGCGGSAPVWNP